MGGRVEEEGSKEGRGPFLGDDARRAREEVGFFFEPSIRREGDVSLGLEIGEEIPCNSSPQTKDEGIEVGELRGLRFAWSEEGG